MLLWAAGVLSMLAQVVILRELVAALFGVELLYVVALGAWLVGTAAGATAGRNVPPGPAVVSAAFLALGALVPAELVFVRAAGVAVGAVPGAYLPFPVQLIGILAATVPPAALCGLLFTVLARARDARPQGLGRSYAIESAGAVAGGLAVTVCFWLGASTLQVAMATAALALAAAAQPWADRRRARQLVTAAVVLVAAAAGMARSDAWDRVLLWWQYPSLVDTRDTPYGRLVITRHDGLVAVFQNGALAFDTEGTSAEAFADLSALQHPAPRRALVIGGGLEGVPAALVPHGLSSIDNLEIDERAFDLGRRYSERLRVPRGTGAVPRLIIGEPRRFFEDAGLYDLILVAMPEPTSGETSRFYTQEFFARCAQHLAPGGVLGIRLPAAENFWPPPLVRLVATIVDALRLEFHHTSVVPGATLYVFASPQPLPSDADVLVGRLAARRVHATLVTPPYLHYLYGNDRRGEVQRVLSGLPVSRPNRDAAPVCYQYAAMLWLAKFYPAVARAEARAGASAVWLACGLGLAVLGLGVAWMRRTAARRAVAFVALVGGAAMGLETVLILRYQMANGVVFVNVGWLLTCFMAGLTAGAWLACPSISRGRPRRSGVALGGTMCLLSGVVAAMTRVEWAADLAGVSVLLLAIGSSAGAAFGYAAGQWEGRGDRAASALYAADVAGGAIAAWGTTLVLVPLAGLDGTALAMAALGAAMLFVIPRSGCGR